MLLWSALLAYYQSEQEIKDSLLSGYDGRVRPTQYSMNVGHTGAVCPVPTADIVTVSMDLAYVEDVNQLELTFTADGLLSLSWFDDRLTFAGTTQGGCTDWLSFTVDEAAPLWKPALSFHNALESYIGVNGDPMLSGDLGRLEVGGALLSPFAGGACPGSFPFRGLQTPAPSPPCALP